MIRLSNVHQPMRKLLFLLSEAVLVCASFLIGVLVQSGPGASLVFQHQHGYQKIFLATLIVLFFCHYFDLYEPAQLEGKNEEYFRLLLIPAVLAVALVPFGYVFPELMLSRTSLLLGLLLVMVALFSWRTTYSRLARWPFLRERVYVLGTGDRVRRLVHGLRSRSELGIDVVDWSGNLEGAVTRESIASHLQEVAQQHRLHRIIVAMADRRGTIPVQELLELRLHGAKIEEAASWLERMSGKIEVDNLYPSWLIFADGFRLQTAFLFLRRVLAFIASAVLLILVLPIIPFVVLAIKIDSPGPILYRQRRVGRSGRVFYCHKFRTMREDAEADTGPTWALDDDPRVTRIGRFLRLSRLDEIPQLWNVVRGDMVFVGPRPERPEFVDMLSREIPYYPMRHIVPPGITGWAQIRYKYGNSVEDAKEKLQYDLYYIKNASVGLDLLIMLQTIKIVLLGRGAQ